MRASAVSTSLIASLIARGYGVPAAGGSSRAGDALSHGDGGRSHRARVSEIAVTSAPAAHAETPATEARTTARWRVYTARVLIVLVAILTAISLLAGYVRYQALDSHTVSDTAGDLIANDAIRAQIAAALTDQLYENTDVSATLQRELPAAQKGLAPVISGAMRELTERAANGLLERPRVQSLWVRSV